MNFPSPGAQFVNSDGERIQVLDVFTGDDGVTVVEVCTVTPTGKLIGPHLSIPVEQWPRFAHGLRRVE